MPLARKLKMGLIGGGPGSFIGDVHAKAAHLDGGMELVAGAFSRDPKKSAEAGRTYLIDPSRAYGSIDEMIAKEKALPEGERIDFVAITTPNNSHFTISRDFLAAGFHIMCEKPMTFTVDEAEQLKTLVDDSGLVFGLMHNYTGYPMVKLARDMARNGELGDIRKVVVRYPQGWLASALEQTGAVQAVWRTDPSQSGAAGAMGDIGTHAENLAEYITGLRIDKICADLNIFVPNRRLDDDGNCLLRFNNGASGVLHASQISIGEENNLAICVYGTEKSIEWHQEHPNYLYVKFADAPMQTWKRGNSYIEEKSPAAARNTRLPFGHPEAFLEAFANTYRNFGDCVRAAILGEKPDPLAQDFPDVNDGLRGMQFIDAVIRSNASDAKWTNFDV